MQAANLLDTPILFHTLRNHIARLIVGAWLGAGAVLQAVLINRGAGKSTAQLREAFNIANDFTAEEEALVSKENAWGA